MTPWFDQTTFTVTLRGFVIGSMAVTWTADKVDVVATGEGVPCYEVKRTEWRGAEYLDVTPC